MNSLDRLRRLKDHLALSKVRHEEQLLLQPTLKDAHVYCVLANLSAQQYGPLLEKYIIQKFNYTKNSASDCVGDCSKGGENVEVKASLGGSEHKKFNYVQIRPQQNVSSYLLTAYHLTPENVEAEGDLYVFRVPKLHMKELLVRHGGYAHGTLKEHGKITAESMEDPKSIREYALRPTYNDACWKSLLPYRIEESSL